jgi:hypothetical protein
MRLQRTRRGSLAHVAGNWLPFDDRRPSFQPFHAPLPYAHSVPYLWSKRFGPRNSSCLFATREMVSVKPTNDRIGQKQRFWAETLKGRLLRQILRPVHTTCCIKRCTYCIAFDIRRRETPAEGSALLTLLFAPHRSLVSFLAFGCGCCSRAVTLHAVR